jgi:hypothetical protein
MALTHGRFHEIHDGLKDTRLADDGCIIIIIVIIIILWIIVEYF